ncbi:MAG: hypothetical protein HYS87_00345 [Candidatus Colwellbacteria bacterium]|nr:hypothetical protein [Candidatus Colwellbacteria bacterium]
MSQVYRNIFFTGAIVTAVALSGVLMVSAHGGEEFEEFEQESEVRSETRDGDVREESRERFRDESVELRERIRIHQEEAREERQDMMEEARVEFRQKTEETRTEFRARIEDERVEFRERTEEARMMHQEAIEERKAEFNERVQVVRDEQKRIIAERSAAQINSINGRLTDAYILHLEKMEMVLDKVIARADEWQERFGLDDSALDLFDSAVDEARAGIAAAKEAVLAQKEKIYTVEFESEENLRQGFQDTMAEFRADHEALRSEYLEHARNLVRTAFDALRVVHTEFVQEDKDDAEEEDTEEDADEDTDEDEVEEEVEE